MFHFSLYSKSLTNIAAALSLKGRQSVSFCHTIIMMNYETDNKHKDLAQQLAIYPHKLNYGAYASNAGLNLACDISFSLLSIFPVSSVLHQYKQGNAVNISIWLNMWSQDVNPHFYNIF